MGVSAARALVVLQRLRFLPMGRPRWCVPPTQEDPPPDVRSFLVPRSDYIIDDNWHVMGLCGTGSKDIVVENAFVPEYRTYSYLDAFYLRHPGAAVNDGPLFRLPFGIVFPYALVAPAIGAALGALQLFREQYAHTRAARDGARVIEDPFVQFRLAEAASEVDAAHARMLHNFEEMMASPAPARRFLSNPERGTGGTPPRPPPGVCRPLIVYSRPVGAALSSSIILSSAPGAMCMQYGRTLATIPIKRP